MRNSRSILALTAGLSLALGCVAQTPNSASPDLAAPPPPPAPSALLQSSLDGVQQAVASLKLDKWKKGTVRDEAGPHISAIQRDLQTTLPPLLKVADAAPATTSKVLPVARNVGALYDVLLSVAEAARVSAPPDQVAQLEQALSGLGNARRSLDDQLQDTATALEKQMIDLRTVVQKQAAGKAATPPPPVAQACTPPPPAHKAKKKVLPPKTTLPATAAPASTTPKPGS